MCLALLALESSPKNDDSFFSPPQESSQSSCPLLCGRVETSDFERAPGSTREEWDSGESGAHGERGKAGWRIQLPCGTLMGWPTAGVRAQIPADEILTLGARAEVLVAALAWRERVL